LRVGGGSGESEAASYGRLHEKDARKKLEQILGLQIAEAKKVVDKGRRMKLKTIRSRQAITWLGTKTTCPLSLH
jgi:hypothetical protein